MEAGSEIENIMTDGLDLGGLQVEQNDIQQLL